MGKHITAQRLQLRLALAPVEHRDRGALAPEQVGQMAEVRFEIAACVLAPGGDHRIHALHHAVVEGDPGVQARAESAPLLEGPARQHRIVFGQLDMHLVAGQHRAHQVVPPHHGQVARHDQPHGQARRAVVPRVLAAPAVEFFGTQGLAVGLTGLGDALRGEPPVLGLGGAQGLAVAGGLLTKPFAELNKT